jgi:hypothetical protein
MISAYSMAYSLVAGRGDFSLNSNCDSGAGFFAVFFPLPGEWRINPYLP